MWFNRLQGISDTASKGDEYVKEAIMLMEAISVGCYGNILYDY